MPVAPDSAIWLIAPGVKLSELGAFCISSTDYSPEESEPSTTLKQCYDDTSSGSNPE